MRALLGAGLAVPRLSLPVECVLRRIFVQTLPPDGVVVLVEYDVCEDGVGSRGGQRVRVGLRIRAGRYAEEAVFGIGRPEASVRTLSDPGNVIAYAPDLIALFRIELRRDKHGKVGFAAGGGKAAAMYLISPSGFSIPRMSICSAIQPSLRPR